MTSAPKAGFAKIDITPRVGVELCGFGPFLNRCSIAVRDRLWARAMAVEHAGTTLCLVSCDLIGMPRELTDRIRALVAQQTALTADAVMLHCTHTHSAPATGGLIGWGEPDAPYVASLPHRIAEACRAALAALRPATFAHAEVPCEGIGRNRERNKGNVTTDNVLEDGWRPAHPEFTDTTCHVVRVEADGKMIGFLSSFGCHPVVCCAETRYIHGDYCGVATNLVEREHPGAVGLFLQGAHGDVNSCWVHRAEQESLLALDVIAGRYARSVRAGIEAAEPVAGHPLVLVSRRTAFTRKPWTVIELRQLLEEQETRLHAPGASDEDRDVRMAMVYVTALRRLIRIAESGKTLSPPLELQGFRIGPLALLGTPFEVFQAIKNDVRARAKCPVPLVLSCCNDLAGYATDRDKAAAGGYAADRVPFICASLPYANIHDELVAALLVLDGALA